MSAIPAGAPPSRAAKAQIQPGYTKSVPQDMFNSRSVFNIPDVDSRSPTFAPLLDALSELNRHFSPRHDSRHLSNETCIKCRQFVCSCVFFLLLSPSLLPALCHLAAHPRGSTWSSLFLSLSLSLSLSLCVYVCGCVCVRGCACAGASPSPSSLHARPRRPPSTQTLDIGMTPLCTGTSQQPQAACQPRRDRLR